MKPTIVHISNDYPDPLQPDKTRAVINLVEGTPEFRHVVYSLNRVNGWSGLADVNFGPDRVAIAYNALPKGLFWERRLVEIADWIAADLKQKNITPDLIEAHKLTVEGLIGDSLARTFGCPLICDVQGNTDLMILKTKLNSRNRYRVVADHAALLFPYAPWVLNPISRLLNLNLEQKHSLLPVMPGFDRLTASTVTNQKRLVTIFRLDYWKKVKNFHRLAEALKQLVQRHPTLTLDVYGRGRDETLLHMDKFIKTLGMDKHIVLKGPIENDKLPTVLGSYTAMVLPSLQETYGLVYAEALFCGLPVLFSKRRCIDGYLDEKKIGYACDPQDTNDIAQGIEFILTHEARLKDSIAGLQAGGKLDFMRKSAILDTYRRGINNVLARREPQAKRCA